MATELDDDEVSGAVEAFLEDDMFEEDEAADLFEESEASETSQQSWGAPAQEEEDVLPEGVPPPSKDHVEVLSNFFGHSSFRPMQWKIIHAALQGQDNCVVMATGYGKSLCYQFPAVYSNGVSVVVSPLISLMQDQVLGLQACNIPACFLGSGQPRRAVYDEMLQGVYRLVYVTPEFIEACSPLLEDLEKRVGIMLFAIDEAHCLSQWGHDFRSAYRKLGSIRKMFPKVPILAVTATATRMVQQDICSVLKLRHPVVTVTSFDRPNLYLEVKLKGKSVLEDLLPLMTQDARGSYQPVGPTIIYCPTKKITEEVTADLRSAGMKCEMYHAGMGQKERHLSHKQFVCDKVEIVIATIAFGMGINKPDVRQIIHYGAPSSLESYYQEIGRAGRDGLPATCTVFYAQGDFNVHRFFVSQIKSAEFQEHKNLMLRKMNKFLNEATCRRAEIISHFTSRPVKNPPKADCCDNCTEMLSEKKTSRVTSALDDEGKYDFSSDAQKIFSTVERCPNCGASSLVSILKGSKNQRVKPHWRQFPTYGAGKDRNESYWKELIQMLVCSDWLSETLVSVGGGRGWARRGGRANTFSYNAIGLADAGYDALNNTSVKVLLKPSTIMMDELRYVVKRVIPSVTPASNSSSCQRVFNPRDFLCKPSFKMPARTGPESDAERSKPQSIPGIAPALGPAVSWNRPVGREAERGAATGSSQKVKENSDPEEKVKMELYQSLLVLRNSLADEAGFMPYLLAPNKTMLLITQERPTTLASLQKIEGMSQAKVTKFGPIFIGHIRSFCKENNLSCQEPDEGSDPAGSVEDLDSQNWTFTKSSSGWLFKRTSGLPSKSVSLGWLSRTRPQAEASIPQQAHSSNVSDKSSEDKGEGTEIVSSKNGNENVDSLVVKDEMQMPSTSEMCQSHNEMWRKGGHDSEPNMLAKADKDSSSASKYMVPKLSDEISGEDRDFFEDFDGNIIENFDDIDFSENLEEESTDFQREEDSHQLEASSISEPLSIPFKTQPSQSTSNTQSTSKGKRGIQYCDSDTEEETKSSANKYERILLNRKKELKESGWIDARKMKKKVKSQFLFKK